MAQNDIETSQVFPDDQATLIIRICSSAGKIGRTVKTCEVYTYLVQAVDGVPAHLPEQGQRGLFDGVFGITGVVGHRSSRSFL